VTHDRWLLDTVCDSTWEVADGQVFGTEGGYSAYVLAQAERMRSAEATEQRRRNLARKELAWLRRGPQARSTKQKFRVQAANTLIAAEPPARDGVELTSLATARLGKKVLELEDVTLRVGGRVLLGDVTWRLAPGERVGLVGVNGAGKTSLLRVLDGALEPSGHVMRGKTVRVGHLSQELAELDPRLRVREAAEEVRMHIQVGKRELSAGQLLESLGFRGDRQWTPVAELSGGERRRLQMLRLLMNEPNVLLLDEPTNDLDIEMLTEFEDLLDGWPGTLVVVSHDRYFLERVTDHIVAMPGDGTLRSLPGGIDEYLELVRQSRTRSGVPSRGPAEPDKERRQAPPGAAPERGVPGGRPPGKQSAAPERGVPGGRLPGQQSADSRSLKKELQRLDRQLERLSARESDLTQELAENASDYEKLTTLGAQLRSLQTEKAGLEDRWLTVAASLDELASVPRDHEQRSCRVEIMAEFGSRFPVRRLVLCQCSFWEVPRACSDGHHQGVDHRAGRPV
jgi:ABC transport system ATP-binding/permease protein